LLEPSLSREDFPRGAKPLRARTYLALCAVSSKE
jgi:hypothetical protein